MPPSDCIHSAARKAWMIHATTKEQRHHRWHSLTLLGCIGGHVLRTRNGNTHPYTPLNSGRYGKATASIMEKKKQRHRYEAALRQPIAVTSERDLIYTTLLHEA
ncbi:hypothetical protein QC764_603438 [Podospora pseudoanserina]|uniref:Uncharacterized protein n=1 Tax=Podospora pseudoanserina TaxID=2609844 RepID=A0ABR0HSL7_9PEZI|nr:hypothetical protein QC764_603438 [Podospora pseudoanserina]